MQILLSSIPIVNKCHMPALAELVEANLDRTSQNRKNSDFTSIFPGENRKNSDFSRVNFLSSSAATAINIFNRFIEQQQNRTWLINLVNFRLKSEKFRFHNFVEHLTLRFASLPARSSRLRTPAPSSWGVALRRLRATPAPSSWGVGAQVAARASASLLSVSEGGI